VALTIWLVLMVGAALVLGGIWLVRKYLTPPHQMYGSLIVVLIGLLFLYGALSIVN
jgi:hypothetical protein